MEVHLEYGLYNTNFRKITWGTKHRFLMAACRLCVCVCVCVCVYVCVYMCVLPD
jgi:hypothetical protein